MLGVWLSREVQPSPVVAYLPIEPVEVLPMAELGGDWILRTKEFAAEEAYARALCWSDMEFAHLVVGSGQDDLIDRCDRNNPAPQAPIGSR